MKDLRISFLILDNLITAEVILMANNNPKHTASGTNVEDVKRRNQQAAQGQQNQQQQGQQQFSTEFASETNAQEVRRRNQQSQQNKQ